MLLPASPVLLTNTPTDAATHGRDYWHWCPGCHEIHRIAAQDPGKPEPRWSFAGTLEAPTFSPSVRHQWRDGEQEINRCCHYFIKQGVIRFCPDSSHHLAGQTVPLPCIPQHVLDSYCPVGILPYRNPQAPES